MPDKKVSNNSLMGAGIGAIFGIVIPPVVVFLFDNKLIVDLALMMAWAPFAFCCFLGVSGLIFSAIGFAIGSTGLLNIDKW